MFGKDKEKIEIRALKPSDLSKDSGIYETIKALSPAEPLTPMTRDRFWSEYENGLNKTFVATSHGRIVAMISVWVIRRIAQGGALVGRIEDVIVHPDFQGKGLGTKLMEEAEKYCENIGVYCERLSCSEDKVPFYEKFGFVRHSVSMKRDLE